MVRIVESHLIVPATELYAYFEERNGRRQVIGYVRKDQEETYISHPWRWDVALMGENEQLRGYAKSKVEAQQALMKHTE